MKPILALFILAAGLHLSTRTMETLAAVGPVDAKLLPAGTGPVVQECVTGTTKRVQFGNQNLCTTWRNAVNTGAVTGCHDSNSATISTTVGAQMKARCVQIGYADCGRIVSAPQDSHSCQVGMPSYTDTSFECTRPCADTTQ